MRGRCLLLSTVLVGSISTMSLALAQQSNGRVAAHRSIYSTDRIIIGWRDPAKAERSQKMDALARSRGFKLSAHRKLDARTHVMALDRTLAGAELDAVLSQLEQDSDIAYASADLRRHPHALTSDPLLSSQWYLLDQQPAATRMHLAWDSATSNSSMVVAVLDTGVLFEHPDLGTVASGGKLLPGYDFVFDPNFSNDGDGRDADPSDPGDWVDSADLQKSGYANCETGPSSWHGTRVSGLIGALTDNATGIAGAAYHTRVLPVRVMSKCGGFDSDILVGMRWAAGLTVDGIPDNPTPASVINLSLGGGSVCTSAYRTVIEEITAHGVAVVVSAGNEGTAVSSPANCPGVIAVAGIRHAGSKVGFSNLGSEVTLSAPGGNCVNSGFGQPCLFSIVVATNTGSTTPLASAYTDEINYNVGTSFSAPQVAATAALMLSVNDRLGPQHISDLLRESATAFPAADPAIPQCRVPSGPNDFQTQECGCTTSTCGAGMLNAAAAVGAAARPLAIMGATGTVDIGSTLTLDASGSFAPPGRSVTSLQWSVSNLVGTAPTIDAPTEAITTLRLPGAASFTLTLTVTDDLGRVDEATRMFATPAQTPSVSPTTPAPRSGGGGGGTLGVELIVLLIVGWRQAKRAHPNPLSRQ
jgi:serine protease